MASKEIGNVGSVKITFIKKLGGEKAITGHFGGICPKSFSNKEPKIQVIVAKSIIQECSTKEYYIKHIEIVDMSNGFNICRFYNCTAIDQYAGYKRIAELFLTLKNKGLTTLNGQVLFKKYCDWDTKPKILGKTTTENKTESTSDRKSSTTKTTTTTTTTTTRTFERVAMFVRRKGKKPSQKVLDTMREKVKAIAEGTYEYKVPCVLIKEAEIEIEITEESETKKDSVLEEAQSKINEAFEADKSSADLGL